MQIVRPLIFSIYVPRKEGARGAASSCWFLSSSLTPKLSTSQYPATLASLPSRPSIPHADLVTLALATSRPVFLSLPPAMMVYEDRIGHRPMDRRGK
ncbi:hypothetical protein D8674_011900 [Pyrus ussuriensis x Pyrus communis]|uniref:Uncharacterized protein n=1 Tax=Pyrus ussuriensis x Pyrus communis TaxID=2448454 RepID=A0A5N5G5L2_9ROSA|nr:hypothetical protein D8674_011900 [Pyrus ussuriensis x Pyrus communis]